MRKNPRSFDPGQMMHLPDYEVFHYRDAKMQEVPLHHHDFYEVYYFLSGKVDYQVEGLSYHLHPEDILLISPRELHRPNVAPDQAYERIVIWIEAGYLQKLSEETPALLSCFTPGNNLISASHTKSAALIRQLADEYSSNESGNKLSARGLFFQFMAELLRLSELRTGSMKPPDTHPLIAQVLRYLGENYRQNLSLESVAEYFFVSKYHLSHLFSESVGTSMYRYILLKRLQHARSLLDEGFGPGEACRESGFQDYANFYRSFRSIYGTSPQDIVKQRKSSDRQDQFLESASQISSSKV